MKVAIILKSPDFSDVVTEQMVIYADAGYKHAEKVGKKKVLAVVGDFDSLGGVPNGEKTVELNVQKDYTDGERAVRYAVELGYDELIIYGAYGGKIEHVLGNIALLKVASNLGVKARIMDGENITELVSGKVALTTKKNGTVSILPYGEKCCITDSVGLFYPLKNLTLTNADTRGISNVAEQEQIKFNVVEGEALVVYPKEACGNGRI